MQICPQVVKYNRQIQQPGIKPPVVFEKDLDRWGFKNVVYVDGVNQVKHDLSATWHQKFIAIHPQEPQLRGW